MIRKVALFAMSFGIGIMLLAPTRSIACTNCDCLQEQINTWTGPYLSGDSAYTCGPGTLQFVLPSYYWAGGSTLGTGADAGCCTGTQPPVNVAQLDCSKSVPAGYKGWWEGYYEKCRIETNYHYYNCITKGESDCYTYTVVCPGNYCGSWQQIPTLNCQ